MPIGPRDILTIMKLTRNTLAGLLVMVGVWAQSSAPGISAAESDAIAGLHAAMVEAEDALRNSVEWKAVDSARKEMEAKVKILESSAAFKADQEASRAYIQIKKSLGDRCAALGMILGADDHGKSSCYSRKGMKP